MPDRFTLAQQLSAVNLARDIHTRQRAKNKAEFEYQRDRLQAAADTLGWFMANEIAIRDWVQAQKEAHR